MTVNSQQNKISYMGNGAAKDFTVPFPYLDKSHLTVRQMLNGVQSERTDWTVSGGTLTFETAPANNAQIVIMRQVPLTQETDYRENEILSAETLERCFDKLTMQVQQLEEKSGRAVTVDVFDDTNAASLIPSIRKAVSDCAAAAVSARANADTASEKAVQAQTSATNAASAETHTAAVLGTKANKDLSNCTKPYVTETYHSGTEWYRVWSDGWIEQGGRIQVQTSTYADVTLLKPFTDANYMISFSHSSSGTGGQAESYAIQASVSYIRLGNSCGNAQYFTWSACGY